MFVVAHLLERGWKVLLPIGENQRYDLVAERDGRFVRIQVKYVTPKRGMLEIKCASSNNWSLLRYSAKDIDAIAAYDSKNENIYFIPVSNVNRSSFNLRIEQSRNNQRLNIHAASAYCELKH